MWDQGCTSCTHTRFTLTEFLGIQHCHSVSYLPVINNTPYITDAPRVFCKRELINVPTLSKQRQLTHQERPSSQKNTQLTEVTGAAEMWLESGSSKWIMYPDSHARRQKVKDGHLSGYQHRKCSDQEKGRPRTPQAWPKWLRSGGLNPILKRWHLVATLRFALQD